MYGLRSNRAVSLALAGLLVATAVARIVCGYTALSVTYDEREQVASGMEWLADGTYTYDVVHPPLSRVLAAIGPFLVGKVPPVAATGDEAARHVGDAILFGSDQPVRMIALARAGNLPFLILAAFGVYLLASVTVGEAAGLVALLLFTTLPPVLAHAGLATTDMAATAMTVLAIAAFVRWLDSASIGRAVVLGVALGLAAIAKLSCLVFVPACIVVLTIWHLLLRFRHDRADSAELRRRASGFVCSAIVTLLVIWAGYRFSLDPAFFEGIRTIIAHNSAGHWSYLLGDVRQSGWWYFFPVALSVKTPLPSLLFAAIGSITLVARSWRERRWQLAVAPLCCVAMLPVLMTSRIDIGVRHALPIYGFLAIAAGHGAIALYCAIGNRLAGVLAVGLLCGWQIVASFVWHPDYLAYFNELALLRRDPVLIDSDLDWGQDFFRLAAALRERRIDSVAVTLSGFRDCPDSGDHDATDYHFPRTTMLRPDEWHTGWIAASYRVLYIADGYSWLLQLTPVARIGRSILLFDVKERDLGRLRATSGSGGRQPVDPCKL
jgi:hypothetical protein